MNLAVSCGGHADQGRVLLASGAHAQMRQTLFDRALVSAERPPRRRRRAG